MTQIDELKRTIKSLRVENKQLAGKCVDQDIEIHHLKQIILASLPALRCADKAAFSFDAWQDTDESFVWRDDAPWHHNGEIKNHEVLKAAKKAVGRP